LDLQAQLVFHLLALSEVAQLQLDLRQCLLAHQLARSHLLALTQLELLLFWLALFWLAQALLLRLPLVQETCRVDDE
jgi:hypothetical protein